MRTVLLAVALGGATVLGACKAPEIADRLDTGSLHYSMSATRDDRELHQSLTAVSMKNELAGGDLVISERARRLIADYAN